MNRSKRRPVPEQYRGANRIIAALVVISSGYMFALCYGLGLVVGS